MQDPYLILGLLAQKMDGEVDDAAVKAAYQSLLKQYSPDQEPERFQQIRKAYELLETHKNRLAYDLFGVALPGVEDMMAVLLPEPRPARPDLKQAQNLLRAG